MANPLKALSFKDAKSGGEVERDAEKLGMKLDCFLCGGSAHSRSGMDWNAVGKLSEDEQELRKSAAEFVKSYSGQIIGNADHGTFSAGEICEIKSDMKTLDPFVAAELLLAMMETPGSARMLTDSGFLNSIRVLGTYVASALVYEIRITGNAASLTDKRIFNSGTAEFFNKLGSEAASEWFNSIGKTGNVEALTSESATSQSVLGAIAENAKIASELSYAIGETGRLTSLTSENFLGFLNGLKTSVAAEYLSAIWCTMRPDELTSEEIMARVLSGEEDVWLNIARPASGSDETMQRVVISKPGSDEHDRGAKLIVQSLMAAGIDVIYTNDANHERIVELAVREGASAIGFSLMDESHRNVLANAVAQIKAKGIEDIALFGGGVISPRALDGFSRSGVRFFNQDSGRADIIGFLNSHGADGAYATSQGRWIESMTSAVLRGGALRSAAIAVPMFTSEAEKAVALSAYPAINANQAFATYSHALSRQLPVRFSTEIGDGKVTPVEKTPSRMSEAEPAAFRILVQQEANIRSGGAAGRMSNAAPQTLPALKNENEMERKTSDAKLNAHATYPEQTGEVLALEQLASGKAQRVHGKAHATPSAQAVNQEALSSNTAVAPRTDINNRSQFSVPAYMVSSYPKTQCAFLNAKSREMIGAPKMHAKQGKTKAETEILIPISYYPAQGMTMTSALGAAASLNRRDLQRVKSVSAAVQAIEMISVFSGSGEHETASNAAVRHNQFAAPSIKGAAQEQRTAAISHYALIQYGTSMLPEKTHHGQIYAKESVMIRSAASTFRIPISALAIVAGSIGIAYLLYSFL